jgi:hypothetical protein
MGGVFAKGLVYWVGIFEFLGMLGFSRFWRALLMGVVGASGGNMSIGGMEQRPGTRTLDLMTNKAETLLNDYFGYCFNTVDDLVVGCEGRCLVYGSP